PSLSLSLFTLAFDDDDVYNEGALAELADFLVVQGYDFHHATDERSGPLAALEGWDRLNWTSVLERFLALGVGAHEIVMAVPLYGYEWPVATAQPGSETRGEAVIIPLAPPPDVVPELPRARARASEHGLRRDPESDSPYYVYRDDSGWHQGWIEDAESLRAKYDFVREHRLGGVALFPLAYGDEAMWNDLRTAFSRPRG
ncbi:MAG TPA: glycosyl hydrolase family 18 protein, partial [Longimicrobiales bacterium]|nr:glycosyl hydrolase family 18 protein [Longimicrobiales bacterium]